MPQEPPPPPQYVPADEAPLRLTKRRRGEKADMDITPMIDIVFLLLIFFLVASKMDEAAAVQLPPARHGGAVAEDSAIVIVVMEGSEDQAVVARRDGQPFSADMDQQEMEIGEYVEAGLTGSAPFGRPMQFIIVKAERTVKEREVARVADAIGKVTDTPTLHYAVLESQ